MKMPKPNGGGDFTPLPEGLHLAVCYQVIDLGTQETNFGPKRQVLISWEIPAERIEFDGQDRPAIFHQRYTFSSHEKATLRQHLEGWRGKRFTDEELDPDNPRGFDIRNLLGKSCQMQIVHNHKNDKTYANITSIVAKPKGMDDPITENVMIYFALDEFSREIFNTLPDWLQEAIKKAPEYQALHQNNEPPAHHGLADDDIPF